ncbi:MAG: cation diffusion facilitator family transporter [Lachnospirales bacterium]
MNKYLINKLLSKKYDINDPENRENIGIITAIIGVISNIFLFTVKIAIGLFMNSLSIMSDSFNNLSDSLSSCVSLFALNISQKPADEEHPFGHGRSEYIASFVVAFIILLIGWEFMQVSFKKILNPEQINFSANALLILFVTVIIKLWQYSFNMYVGKTIDSKVLVLTAKDSLNDVLITCVTILSVVLARLTGLIIDGYIGFVLSLWLVSQGFSLLKETISPLLGESIQREHANEIKKFVESYEHVIGTHDLLLHNYGPTSNMCTLHVEVPDTLSITMAHEIIDKIELDLLREKKITATLHMDPVDVDNEDIKNIKIIVMEQIQKELLPFYVHDFRLATINDSLTIIFDLEIPYKYNEEEVREFIEICTNKIDNYNSDIKCIINIEHSYIL